MLFGGSEVTQYQHVCAGPRSLRQRVEDGRQPQFPQGAVLGRSNPVPAGARVANSSVPRVAPPVDVRPRSHQERQILRTISTKQIVEVFEAKICNVDPLQGRSPSSTVTGMPPPSDNKSATCLSSASTAAGTPSCSSIQTPVCTPPAPPSPATLADRLGLAARIHTHKQPSTSKVPGLPREALRAACVPTVTIKQPHNASETVPITSKAMQDSSPSLLPLTYGETERAATADETLGDDSAVKLGGQMFDLGRELGRGAFGVVWEAIERGDAEGRTVAVKVSNIQDNAVVSELVECQVLRRLNQKLSANCSEATCRVPKYLAHSAEASKVTLAMTKVDGCPLDSWLYGMDASDGHKGRSNLAGACSFATTLLSQMAPVFSALEPIAFHRDISGHNFMIDDSSTEGCPKFTMIDFGLAVEASDWKKNWQKSGIAGDPRYWSPAHWSQFCIGAKVMEKLPAFARLYRERLDHYSFGVLLLELVFGMWDASSTDEVGEAGALELVFEAQARWKSYWSCVHKILEIFRLNKKNGNRMREQIMASGLLANLPKAHRELCCALRAAANAEFFSPGAAEIAPLLIAATELIDPASTLSWDEVPVVLRGDTAQFLHKPAACAQNQPVHMTPSSRIRDVSPVPGTTALLNGGPLEMRLRPRLDARSPAVVGPPPVQHPRSVSRAVFPQRCSPLGGRSSLGGPIPCRTDMHDRMRRLAKTQGTISSRATIGAGRSLRS